MANDELDDLLKELKATGPVVPPPEKPMALQINEESINQYILDNAAKLISAGLDSVQALKDTISLSFEAKEVEAYAVLIKSVADSMDIVNKINITNKKIKTAKELKNMDIEARRQLGPNITTNNTNVLVATRDEIIKGLMQAALKPASQSVEAQPVNVIDVTDVTEVSEPKD